MRLSKQKNRYDCGVAVLEMLTGNKEVRPKMSPIVGERKSGLSVSEFVGLWEILGDCQVQSSKKGYRKELHTQFYWITGVCALLIRAPEKSTGHWVLVDQRGKIYDPELTRTYTIEEYPRREWLLIRSVASLEE